jgi:hypothetical protein
MEVLWHQVKTVWDLLQELIAKRWVRYLAAAIFIACGLLVGALALAGWRIQTVSGVVRTVKIERDAQTGDYQDHLLTLDGSPTAYTLTAGDFAPALPSDALRVAERVDLWYTQTPPFDPDVVALQIYDANGTPMQYTTSFYADPAGGRASNLVTAAAFILAGLLALVAAIWLPVRAEPGAARDSADRPAKQARYGESVVGPRRTMPDRRDRGTR